MWRTSSRSRAVRTATAAAMLSSCAPTSLTIGQVAVQGTEHTCHFMKIGSTGEVDFCGAPAGRWTGREFLDLRGERQVWLGLDGTIVDARGAIARRTDDGRISVASSRGEEILSATIDADGTIVATGALMEQYSGKPVARLDPAPVAPAAQMLTGALFLHLLQGDVLAGALGVSRCTCRH